MWKRADESETAGWIRVSPVCDVGIRGTMPASRQDAIRRTEGDIHSLRALTSGLSARGFSQGDCLVQAAFILLRERVHQLFLLEWPSGAP